MPPDPGRANPFGALTDVPGLQVGHADRSGDGWLTGCTVVIPPQGTVGGVDVRGGGPATAETDALAPGTLTRRVDAVLLTGGSAYGLPAVAGVQRWCEERSRGFQVGQDASLCVPIVPALALFDLGRGGDFAARPDAHLARAATDAARDGPVATGTVGAGTGAAVAGGSLKGGVGTASVRLGGQVVVGALVALNAAGSPLDPATGALLAASAIADPARRPRTPSRADHDAARSRTAATPPRNTTLVVVATNARLSPAQVTRLAVAAQSGLARAVAPVHTLADGDVAVALSTGEQDVETAAPHEGGWQGAAEVAAELAVQTAAADVVTLAVLDAVLSASSVSTPTGGLRSYRDLYLSAFPPGP